VTAAVIGEFRGVWGGDDRPALCAVGLKIERYVTLERTEIGSPQCNWPFAVTLTVW
jgi:hypothetical protein